jgi:hypothetical protein
MTDIRTALDESLKLDRTTRTPNSFDSVAILQRRA